MKSEVTRFLKKVCERYQCHALWYPGAKGGVYFIHKNGRGIQTFTLDDFYALPKRYRFFMIEPLIKKGMNHNLGQDISSKQIFSDFKIGKKIY